MEASGGVTGTIASSGGAPIVPWDTYAYLHPGGGISGIGCICIGCCMAWLWAWPGNGCGDCPGLSCTSLLWVVPVPPALVGAPALVAALVTPESTKVAAGGADVGVGAETAGVAGCCVAT